MVIKEIKDDLTMRAGQKVVIDGLGTMIRQSGLDISGAIRQKDSHLATYKRLDAEAKKAYASGDEKRGDRLLNKAKEAYIKAKKYETLIDFKKEHKNEIEDYRNQKKTEKNIHDVRKAIGLPKAPPIEKIVKTGRKMAKVNSPIKAGIYGNTLSEELGDQVGTELLMHETMEEAGEDVPEAVRNALIDAEERAGKELDAMYAQIRGVRPGAVATGTGPAPGGSGGPRTQ